MLFSGHLAAGLIIGSLTGDYSAAILGSVVMDSDHLITYFKHGILLKPKKFFQAVFSDDLYHEDRNYFHSLFVAVPVMAILIFFFGHFGIVFSMGYATHLLFDSFDSSYFYPFYPKKKVNIQGFLPYASRWELLLTSFLLIGFLVTLIV